MGEKAGWIVIGTKLDSKQLEKDLNNQRRELKNYEKEAENLLKQKSKAGEDLQSYEKELALIKETTDEMLKQAQTKAEVDNILDLEKRQIDELNKKYSDELVNLKDINSKLEENATKQDLIKTKISETALELNKVKNLENINFSMNKISNNITRIVKKVGRWALAIFGIRGAYMAVRNAINVISQDDKQLKADIDYMKNVFAYALEPVVRKIVELAKQLFIYIGYIIKTWTGKNIFENANKSLQNANSSAKELRKTLTGFDEMNILNENGSVGSAGILPSFDLSSYGGDMPKWVKWIANNKDSMLEIISAIAGALIALKLGGLDPLLMVLGGIMGLGIYQFVSGIIEMIKDPSWEAFGKILQGLGIIIADIGAILLLLGVASGPVGWIIVAVGLLITLIGTITVELNKNRDGIKSVEEATNDLNDAKLALYDAELNYTRAIENEIDANERLSTAIRNTGIDAETLYNQVYEGTRKYEDLSDAEKEVYNAYVNLMKAQGQVKKTADDVNEAKKETTRQTIEEELATAKATGSYDKFKKTVIEAYKKGQISAQEASDYISRAMANMDYETMKVFSKDIPDSIKKGLDPYQYKTKMDKFKAWWNGEIASFNREIKIKWSSTGGQIYIPPYGGTYAKGGIYYPNLPRLASGGIINQPGRGVPYHGATIGERGAEAVVPLTDSQQMALLGETIGKYVTINATIPVYAYNRVVDRKIERIRAEDNFATNR